MQAESSTSQTAPRGLFIVLEGLDRCGKSTQVDRLVKHLDSNERPARLQKFPDRTTAIGKMIDSYLQSKSELDDRAIHLLFSANRWECATSIERDLQAGITVVADRYAFSGIAFSAAKGLPFDFCLNPDKGLPLPDAILYLTLPPEIASARAAYGVERYETVTMQEQVKNQFAAVAAEVKKRHGEDSWTEISASGTIEEVEGLIHTRLDPLLSAQREAIGRLWQ